MLKIVYTCEDSSFIDTIQYIPDAKVLYVSLIGSPVKTYLYRGVSNEIVKFFIKAPSKGKFFNQVIKPNYKGEKLN